MSDLLSDLEDRLRAAVKRFWTIRGLQSKRRGRAPAQRGTKDRGNRSAVTGGKHLDGFLKLIVEILEAAGLQRAHIYWQQRTELPGWFRPEKRWDLVVVADKKLVAVVEFKSQVGSFGNNFNNRTEEALGNATDLWAAYEEGAFAPSERPWLGFLMLLEDAPGSTRPVVVQEPHFKVFPEFKNASYMERYNQLLTRLVRKRFYDAGCFLMSSRDEGKNGEYSEPNSELGFTSFVTSLLARAAAVARVQPPRPQEPPKIETDPSTS